MPSRWSKIEEKKKRQELTRLYVRENKTIGEIGKILGLGAGSVYDRLIRLNIPVRRAEKPRHNNSRNDINIPIGYSENLAEFFGIMLGDGKLAKYQIIVTLGIKEMAYAEWVRDLMERIFTVKPRIAIRRTGYKDVYFGSIKASQWLLS